jgi:hypothetical protein
VSSFAIWNGLSLRNFSSLPESFSGQPSCNQEIKTCPSTLSKCLSSLPDWVGSPPTWPLRMRLPVIFRWKQTVCPPNHRGGTPPPRRTCSTRTQRHSFGQDISTSRDSPQRSQSHRRPSPPRRTASSRSTHYRPHPQSSNLLGNLASYRQMRKTTRLRSSSILGRRSILFASFQELYHGKVLSRKQTSDYHRNILFPNVLHRFIPPNQNIHFGKVFAVRMMLNKLANNSASYRAATNVSPLQIHYRS